MAKKKPESELKYPQNRTTTPTTFRLTPEFHEIMERLSKQHELSKTALLEVSVRLFDDTMKHASVPIAKKLLNSAKKSKGTT